MCGGQRLAARARMHAARQSQGAGVDEGNDASLLFALNLSCVGPHSALLLLSPMPFTGLLSFDATAGAVGGGTSVSNSAQEH